MATRPHQTIIHALWEFFNSPAYSIPSNFPALARRIEYLQKLDGAPADPPVYSSEAPQEREVDRRIARRKVETALRKLSPHHQAVMVAAYNPTEQDPRVEQGLTPILAGLSSYSKWHPVDRYADDHKVLSAIRIELDEIWRQAHKAFEKEYRTC